MFPDVTVDTVVVAFEVAVFAVAVDRDAIIVVDGVLVVAAGPEISAGIGKSSFIFLFMGSVPLASSKYLLGSLMARSSSLTTN